MNRILITLCALLFVQCAVAQDATTAWREVLGKCARSDKIGKQSLFFGVSNTIGPGSVWRRADDGAIRLLFELQDAFPQDSDRKDIVKINNVGSCLGNSSSRWNLKLGLPFSIGTTPLSLDIAALLGQAKNVTVSVTGFAIDDLAETNWKNAFNGLGEDNAYYQEIHQSNRIVAESAVKITGFKAVFDYKRDLSVDVKAKYKDQSFAVGQNIDGAASNGHKASGNSGKGNDSAGASAAGGASGSEKPSGRGSENAAGLCSMSASSESKNVNGANGTIGTTRGTENFGGPAVLHISFSGNRQISICAEGPFYIIAAYSRLQDATPVGFKHETFELLPFDIPKGAVADISHKGAAAATAHN